MNLGFSEIFMIGLVALLVFGPDKLPELARLAGRAVREFRKASAQFNLTMRDTFEHLEDGRVPEAPLRDLAQKLDPRAMIQGALMPPTGDSNPLPVPEEAPPSPSPNLTPMPREQGRASHGHGDASGPGGSADDTGGEAVGGHPPATSDGEIGSSLFPKGGRQADSSPGRAEGAAPTTTALSAGQAAPEPDRG